MTTHQQIVTVIGGTGFIGRYVVRALAQAGYTVNVVARQPQLALRLKTAGNVAQVVLQKGDITRPKTLEGKLNGSFAVVNLAGILKPGGGRQNFNAVHIIGAKNVAELAAQAGVKRLVHISALGADAKAAARYFRSKAAGEEAVREAFPEATLLRPGIVFGAEDNFYNLFASLARLLPALPLIGGGKTRFQPVYAGDVATAVVAALRLPGAKGQVYELAGPKSYSFKEILSYILQVTHRKACLLPIPFPLASLTATTTGWLPGAPLTADQVRMLKQDNLAEKGAKTLTHLGVIPTSVETVVPEYLARYSARGVVEPSSPEQAV